MDVHARIQEFLQQKTIMPLLSDSPRLEERYVKAGVVPFVPGQPTMYYFMQPVARRPELAKPAFQICKGTRMMQDTAGQWKDMTGFDEEDDHSEPLAVTALREGIEELGLKLEAIGRMFDVGPYRFTSEINGKSKRMWLFALEMSSQDEVLPMSQVADTTHERAWLSLDEFAIAGRADHRYILRDIDAKLKTQY